jgi:hypothetical protein
VASVAVSEETPLPSSIIETPVLDPTANLSRKAVLMQLFTESGMAKINGILMHLEAFLSDVMSGKVV